MPNKFVNLKPFAKEKDPDRNYDILRSIVFAKAMAKRGKMSDKQRQNLLTHARTDLKLIGFLRRKYPCISEETVKIIANEQNVLFQFWTQQNTRTKPKFVTKIGSVGIVIDLKISGFETFHQISFKNLTMLLETDKSDFYRSLNKKIKKFPSLSDAVNYFTGKSMTETEFFEIWGDNMLRFREEERFIENFGIGYSIWTDDSDCKKLRKSWFENHIPILLSKAKYKQYKIDIHDEITVVIDKEYLRDFHCQFCYTSFKEKRKLLAHEQKCQNDTEYNCHEKQYGGDVQSIREILVDENILPANDDCFKHFCSFDIECVNIPESLKYHIYGIINSTIFIKLL